MTKRFIYDGLHIRDLHGKIPPILTNNDKIRDKYLIELNELHEENQDLSTKKEDAEYELLHLKEKYEELLEENEQLKKALGCIRKRYDCSIEEFVEDLKDNGIDLIKVDLE